MHDDAVVMKVRCFIDENDFYKFENFGEPSQNWNDDLMHVNLSLYKKTCFKQLQSYPSTKIPLIALDYIIILFVTFYIVSHLHATF